MRAERPPDCGKHTLLGYLSGIFTEVLLRFVLNQTFKNTFYLLFEIFGQGKVGDHRQ